MKILLVEDQETYRRAAQEYFNRTNCLVDYASDYDEALERLEKNNYDGIITDIFFPKNKSGDTTLGLLVYQEIDEVLKGAPAWCKDVDELEALLEAIHSDEYKQPLGVKIAQEAEKSHIPFVLSSSLFHHNKIVNPICSYQRLKGWPEIVDGPAYGPIAKILEQKYKKDTPEFWKRAHEQLKQLTKH